MTDPAPKDETPPPAPRPPALTMAPAQRSRAAAPVAWLILVLLVVVAAVGTSPYWAPNVAPLLPWGQQPPPANPNAAAIRDVQDRLDADEAALKQQAAQLARLGAAEQAIKDQAARLTQLEARPAPTAAPAPPPSPPAQSAESAAAIKALQDQIAKLTADNATTSDRLAKLTGDVQSAAAGARADRAQLVALANLRIAVEGAGPFQAELAAAQALASGNATLKAALATLDGDAKTGLPTMAALAAQFDRAVAPAILRARSGGDAHADWWQQMRSRIERLVVIRRIGPDGSAPRDATEAAVAQADAALKAGDLAAAAAALDRLSGDAARAAAPWLAVAKKRIAAEATLAKLWRDEAAKGREKS